MQTTKPPMSSSYKAVFIFSIIMIPVSFLLGAIASGGKGGAGLSTLWWGFTAWYMYKRNIDALVSLQKTLLFLAGILGTLTFLLLISNKELEETVGFTPLGVVVLIAISMSVHYGLFLFFRKQLSSLVTDTAESLGVVQSNGGGGPATLDSSLRTSSKKFLKWTLLIAGGLAVIGSVLFGAFLTAEKWNNRPRVVDTLRGIRLGEKFSDVEFRNGEFTKIESDPKTKKRSPNGQDYNRGPLFVSVSDGHITSVGYTCDKGSESFGVNGISCGTEGEKIEKMFGSSLRVLCSTHVEDPRARFFRVYDVVKYGTRYLLKKNKMQRIVIYTPEYLDTLVNLNWKNCD
jgi:hypothetical protein